MKSRIPFSGKGAKTQQKHGPYPPPRQKKKQKFLDLTRRGKSNDIAHRPIIQVFTVCSPERCAILASNRPVRMKFSSHHLYAKEVNFNTCIYLALTQTI